MRVQGLRPRARVAIVGGGITGAIAAQRLSDAGIAVTVFDQGRRGPGGRASHRRVHEHDGHIETDDGGLPPAAGTFEFDHGCQFFRADDPEMRALAETWCAAGWASEWRARFGRVSGAPPFGPVDDLDAENGAGDFFGLPISKSPVYVGVGGMHRLPRAVLKASGATVRRGVRVKALRRVDAGAAGTASGGGGWELLTNSGEGAFHDTSEEAAAAAVAQPSLETFDAVLLTDVSSSFDQWHRASAGLPPDFAARVSGRGRVPLFSCMVAFSVPLDLPLDAITLHRSSVLWFAARSASKPGFPEGSACWTLISTPAFACEEIRHTPMQDASGVFLPQSNDYLSSGPAPALIAAFKDAVAPMLAAEGRSMPDVVYSQAQRWGSALPATRGWREKPMVSMGVTYHMAIPPLLPALGAAAGEEFVADDDQLLFYAGDFCSGRAPGFEAAALSGASAAAHITALLRHNNDC